MPVCLAVSACLFVCLSVCSLPGSLSDLLLLHDGVIDVGHCPEVESQVLLYIQLAHRKPLGWMGRMDGWMDGWIMDRSEGERT